MKRFIILILTFNLTFVFLMCKRTNVYTYQDFKNSNWESIDGAKLVLNGDSTFKGENLNWELIDPPSTPIDLQIFRIYRKENRNISGRWYIQNSDYGALSGFHNQLVLIFDSISFGFEIKDTDHIWNYKQDPDILDHYVFKRVLQ